ncbi:MAG TPA: bifunctional helix-turn-helix transcriptional regulator/GNAT family N-acetyltransferase [Gaiellaceae bacterium]|jgi:DNA-binding MarR family transcriptional regulator
MDADQIAGVRSFNRTTTERVGALGDDFLERKRPLGEARALWEIGRSGTDVRELRRRLGLDSGYMSRLLRALEEDGLVTLSASSNDGRVRRAELSPSGRKEWDELELRSDAFAESVLEPLSERQRGDLVDAMETVERLLTASMIDVRVESPRSAAARWCLEQYFLELQERFEAGFDPARSIPADADELTLPAGLLLVARLRGDPVGCGALKLHGEAPAEIKRMWVSPTVRGLGLGRRILRELEDRARENGVTVARLETNRSLAEAISLYRAAGYREVAAFNDEAYAHHWFEKRL